MMNTEPPAVLVVGHGSRDVEGVEEFHTLASHLRHQFPERDCETGFLEFATPLISDGVDRLVQRGARRITAVPGMLMAAGHAKNDIPSELNALQQHHPEVEIRYGTELGVHARMIKAAGARIEEAEADAGADYDRADTVLLVVGRGASDSDANSNISKIARMLWEGMGFGWAEVCYSGVTRPSIAEGLKRASMLGFRRVLVFPYFLFTGRLVKRIYDTADEFASENPGIDVVKAPYLRDHPEVIAAFIDRLHTTERGEGRMNCQLCQYREQIIGFEDRVGQPQEGHHHHVRGAGTDADHSHGHHHHHHHTHHHGG
ncbi:sirohydrochlorin chelatase [Arhodomonas sp. AD133]|uniref:sirohydrochlorin chelatase n=1 Tax=Arhodomonas sp. AD133 TaxID=3415009 RepID=UPI003EBD77B3